MGSNIFQMLIFLLLTCLPCIKSTCFNYPAVFNFGDSNSDTGEMIAGVGRKLHPPNGQTYFKKTSGRLCDGRLVVDFLMDALGLPFLNPYLAAVGTPSFRTGCNFAAADSTILMPNASSKSPFSLGIQVAQFTRFKTKVQDLQGKGLEKYIPAQDSFQTGLYMLDTGFTDLAGASSLEQITDLMHNITSTFEQSIQALYVQGARNFWIHNTGPLGCLPLSIARFSNDTSKLDELGCVGFLNNGSRVLNQNLLDLSRKFQSQHPDSNVTYIDIFTIKSDLIANYSLHGFEQPSMACCGYGGPPLNFDSGVVCGGTGLLNNGTWVTSGVCNDSSKYVIWDGIHYTEAANKFVASQILTGKYSI